jgi:HEAT repeat protein
MKLVAIRAIASVEIEALADLVGERLGDDDDRVAATAAVATLRGFGQAAGVATDMMTSEDPEARRIAVDGIAKKVGSAAIEDVRTAALDSDANVRMVAIRWLGTWQDAASSDVMLRNLTHPDAGVRAASVTALAQVGLAQNAAPADLLKLATKALGDPALAVRLAGVSVLVDAKATAELTKLVDDPHPLVAIEAAMGAKVSAQSALDRAATHEQWTVRAGALNLVARADKDYAVTYANKLANDSELRVRLAAGRVLAAAWEREAATAIFVAAIATPTDDNADLGAAGDLARLHDERGTDALEAALRDTASAPERRIAAASAHLGARVVTPALVAALADPNGLVRVHAAATLAELVDDHE